MTQSETIAARLQSADWHQDMLNGHNAIAGDNGDQGELARLLSWLGRDYLLAKDAPFSRREFAHSAMASRIERFFEDYIVPRAKEDTAGDEPYEPDAFDSIGIGAEETV